TRREWMRHVLPMTTAAYCTDGDWAASNNLRHLMQGADERQCSPPGTQKDIDILFVGNARGHSPERAQFVSHMRDRYGDRFVHIHRYFGKRLAHYVQRSRIVIAPPTPVTDRYFSNRIYIMLGLGAFLLHQQSALAASQYRDGEEIVFYNGLDDLHDK